MFVWDEAKRRINLRKHGIDFADADKIFRGLTLTAEDESSPFARPRIMKRATTSRRSRTDFARLRTLDDSTIVRDRDAPQWTPELFARAVARHGLKPLPK